jgi:DNA-binding winged helix-turn-helix (wHTH) protein/TolB-like protein
LSAHALRDPAGRPVELRPQAFDVLQALAERRGELVTREALFDRVWPGLVVTDDSLVQAVGDIRRALGDTGRELVRTVPRRGYLLEAAPPASPRDRAEPPTAPQVLSPAHPLRSRWIQAALAGLAALGIAGAFAAWRWMAPPEATAPRQPSIAVLPFRAPSADGEPLARDLAAHLVSELGRSADLRVLASQSSFALADQQLPLFEIGRRLRSRYVRRSGERLAMTIELLDSEDGRVVWSALHDVDRDTLAAAQRSLVERIAGSLQARVARLEERRVLEAAPQSLDVVALTAQGRTLWWRSSSAPSRSGLTCRWPNWRCRRHRASPARSTPRSRRPCSACA